jgi:hypothetical protein
VQVAQCLLPPTTGLSASTAALPVPPPPALEEAVDASTAAATAAAHLGVRPVGTLVLLMPGRTRGRALHVVRTEGPVAACFRLAGVGMWSTPVPLGVAGVAVALVRRGAAAVLYRLTTQMRDGAWVCTVAVDPGPPPYRLENATATTVCFAQADEPPDVPLLWTTVAPGRAAPFAWHWLVAGGRRLWIAREAHVTLVDVPALAATAAPGAVIHTITLGGAMVVRVQPNEASSPTGTHAPAPVCCYPSPYTEAGAGGSQDPPGTLCLPRLRWTGRWTSRWQESGCRWSTRRGARCCTAH